MLKTLKQGSPLISASRVNTLLLFLIISIGFLLRLYQLDYKSLWLDEIGQVLLAKNDLFTTIRLTTSHAAAPPLDYILTHISINFGRSEFALRLFPVLWSTLSILLVYLLGKKLASSQEIGLLASALLAISTANIQYAQEVRFYSLFSFLNLLIILAFFNLLQKQTIFSLLAFTISITLGFYTHYYTIFTIFACSLTTILFFFAHKTKFLLFFNDPLIEKTSKRFLKAFFIALLLTFLLVIPWIIFSGGGITNQFVFRAPPLEQIFVLPIFSTHQPVKWVGFLLYPILASSGILLAIYKRLSWVVLPTLVILISVPGIILLDKVFSYFYSFRQLVYLLPLYSLLVAAGLYYLITYLTKFKPLQIVLIGIFFIGMLQVFIPSIITYYDWPKAGWRETASYISQSKSSTPIISYPASLHKYLTYYAPTLQQRSIPTAYLDKANAPADARVWWLSRSQDAEARPSGSDWELIDVSSGFNNKLYYLGRTDRNTLINEILSQGINPRTIVYSSILSEIQNIDINMALKLSEETLDSINQLEFPLTAQENAILLSKIGRLKYDANLLDDAILNLEAALVYDPRNQEALNNLGLIYLSQDSCAKAEMLLKKSVKYHSNNYWGNLLLGNSYYCQNSWANAANAYMDAYNSRPNSGILLKAAQAYLADEKIELARQALIQIKQDFSDSPEAQQAKTLLLEINE